MCKSVPHTPQAPILMSAALRPTSGHGTERMTGGAPGPAKVATRIMLARMTSLRGDQGHSKRPPRVNAPEERSLTPGREGIREGALARVSLLDRHDRAPPVVI